MQEREKEQCDWKVSKPKQHHHTRNSHERGQEGNMRVGRINQQPVPKASPASAAWYCFFDRIEEALKHHNERERESNELSFNHDVSMSTSESMREREPIKCVYDGRTHELSYHKKNKKKKAVLVLLVLWCA